jgi:hypothetical protein
MSAKRGLPRLFFGLNFKDFRQYSRSVPDCHMPLIDFPAAF